MNISNINFFSAFNWYGFIIGAAIVCCLVIAYFVAQKRGYYKDLIFDIAIICVPLAIVGARLYYVIFDIIGGGGSWTFKQILGIGTGGLQGLAIYGGLIGAGLGAAIIHFWKRNKKPQKDSITLMQLLDLGFTFIILGQAIGRWGNFANQEAYGPKVNFNFFPITVKIDAAHGVEGAGYYLATFFYESLWNIIGFIALFKIYTGKKQSFDGFIFSLYCIYYGIGRTWIEGLRQDSLMLTSSIRVSQLFSILMIVFGFAYILTHFYFARSKGLKPFVFIDRQKLDDTYYGYTKSILHHPNDYTKKKEETDFSDDFYSTADSGFSQADAENFYNDKAVLESEKESGSSVSDDEKDVKPE